MSAPSPDADANRLRRNRPNPFTATNFFITLDVPICDKFLVSCSQQTCCDQAARRMKDIGSEIIRDVKQVLVMKPRTIGQLPLTVMLTKW